MHRISSILIMAAVLLAMTLPATAQRHGRERGERPREFYGSNYDMRTVETIRGEVVDVQTERHGPGRGEGMHLMLKTETETIPVHLGPVWYLDEQKVSVKAGDVVEITGSRTTFEEKPVILASGIATTDSKIRLRDDRGVPLWAGNPQGIRPDKCNMRPKHSRD